MTETTTKTTKQDDLLRLLGRKNGATGAQLSSSLGWQPHTVRAAISRLRKAGHTIERVAPAKPGGASRWRLASGASG